MEVKDRQFIPIFVLHFLNDTFVEYYQSRLTKRITRDVTICRSYTIDSFRSSSYTLNSGKEK